MSCHLGPTSINIWPRSFSPRAVWTCSLPESKCYLPEPTSLVSAPGSAIFCTCEYASNSNFLFIFSNLSPQQKHAPLLAEYRRLFLLSLSGFQTCTWHHCDAQEELVLNCNSVQINCPPSSLRLECSLSSSLTSCDSSTLRLMPPPGGPLGYLSNVRAFFLYLLILEMNELEQQCRTFFGTRAGFHRR